jgi:diguanylate cyclase (GGDEF)-like protein
VRGVVRSADLIVSSSIRATSLKLQSEGGYIDVVVDSKDATPLKDMLDAEVEVTGASSGRFDGKMQQTGVLIHVTSLAGVKVLNRAQSSPWSLPVTPMGEVLTSFHVKDQTQRVRVQGIITYYQPGSSVVLQDGTRSLWIRTDSIAPLHVGNVADATGFPNVHDGFLTLTSGEIQESQKYAPISPQAQTWKQLVTSKHVFDLVSVEGTVVTEVRGGAQDEYVLTSEGYIFSAVYHHPDVEGVAPLSPLEHIPTGSTVRVTGICVLESSNPFDRDVPFNILLRSSEDLAVIAEPSWLNIRNLMLIVGMLLLAVVAASVWGWTLKRKVRRQTAALSTRIEAEAALERQLAQLEQRRSRILEDINGTEPLAGILERITELTSFRLGGSPCWCEITDGARLGEFPREGTDLRIIHQEIPARSGPALGKLFAGFVAETKPGMHEAEALSVGAKLATLAIETRRLYSDLLHRSEFDLLTDIHNRFSLDKYLDARIEEARQKAAIFGLIYVDLDLFKQVNDLYGHQIGDLYLREVSLRMKRQLRTGDMLARLGGDEFAALVPTVRNRAEVEEIALRLEHCFDDPFLVDGSILQGSASVGIAIYPENGVTKDSLLNAADAAMYVAKNANRYVVGVAAAGPDPDKH